MLPLVPNWQERSCNVRGPEENHFDCLIISNKYFLNISNKYFLNISDKYFQTTNEYFTRKRHFANILFTFAFNEHDTELEILLKNSSSNISTVSNIPGLSDKLSLNSMD